MATLRQLRTRVASIKNIQRVTRAMKLVAAAKVRRAQEAIVAARPYALQLERVLRHLQHSAGAAGHPLLSERPGVRVLLAMVTSDRGLCGAFNASICRRVQAEIRRHPEGQVRLITVGRKGRDFFRNRGYQIARHHADVFRALSFSRAVQIAQDLTRTYLSGEVDRVLLVFSEFKSVAHQAPVIQQLLPIAPASGGAEPGDYLFEPSPELLLEALVPRHVNFQVWRALLESVSSSTQAQRVDSYRRV